MITTQEVTVGDTGLSLSGQLNGGGLVNLDGCTVKLDVLGIDNAADLRLTGRSIITNQTATVTVSAERRVSYKFQTNDVAVRALGIIRWTVTLPAGAGFIHFPGPKSDQVVLQINP